MAAAFLQAHYESVQYERTDYVVPWSVLKTQKINNKPISEETLTYLVGFLKTTGQCKIGMTPENERVGENIFSIVMKFKLQTCFS